MLKLTREEIQSLIEKSNASLRKRAALPFHPSEKLGTRCIINCIQQDSYVAPHLHPNLNGQEIWMPLQGKIAVLIFTEEGKINDKMLLSSTDHIFIEIPNRTYHTAVALERNSIMYELSEGPYFPDSYKKFAPWAPSENDRERAVEYLQQLKRELL